MIEEARVHPITALTTLSEGEKRRLMDQKIVLCKHILAPHLLEQSGIKPSSIPTVLEEARHLCGDMRETRIENRKQVAVST